MLCSTFNQAPSTSVQLLLDHLRNAHGLRVDAGKVSVLALPRDDEAMAVKDDSGEPPIDDEDGYHLKRDQILRTLASGDGALNGVPILFFNAKKDDAAKVRRGGAHGGRRGLSRSIGSRCLPVVSLCGAMGRRAGLQGPRGADHP